jgi:hypothetical protein
MVISGFSGDSLFGGVEEQLHEAKAAMMKTNGLESNLVAAFEDER